MGGGTAMGAPVFPTDALICADKVRDLVPCQNLIYMLYQDKYHKVEGWYDAMVRSYEAICYVLARGSFWVTLFLTSCP